MKNLFTGIAVVIDDEIKNDGKLTSDGNPKDINAIIKHLQDEKIPIVTYTSLPPDESIKHFQNISFLILDWQLIGQEGQDTEDGVTIPGHLKEENETSNIKFIRDLTGNCFCPIFIFTNEDTDKIKEKLESAEILKDNLPSNLFIENKSNLSTQDILFKKITEWLSKTPSMYILKEWEQAYKKAETQLFLDFSTKNADWPSILWQTFTKDDANPSVALKDVMLRNIASRLPHINFKEEILKIDPKKETDKSFPSEIRKVLEGSRFLKKESLQSEEIGTGDVFKIKQKIKGEELEYYLLNIRAQCDLVLRLDKGNPPLTETQTNTMRDKILLYCLKGEPCPRVIFDKNGKKKAERCKEARKEAISDAVVECIAGEQIIKFSFKDFEIKNWKSIKRKRIGRLLPPYITQIQQRFSLYMQREGLPKIPDEAFADFVPKSI